MPRSRFSKKVLASVIAASCVYTPASFSQVLEEVIVTARKRAETMQDVPISITAFSGDALEKAGYKEIQNLNEAVPNLEFSGGSEVAQVFIRGIGQRDQSSTVDPGVGIYLDGIYLARVDGQMIDTADVASVQVLRGPQGTLFGKNNVGGAMLIELVNPEEEFNGYVELGASNLSGRDGKLMLNVPLVEDKLYSRVTVSSRARDGYMQHIETGKMASDLDRMSAIGQLRWLVNDNASLDVLIGASKQAEERFGFNCTAANNGAALPHSFMTIPDFDANTLEASCARSQALLAQDKFDADGAGAYQSDTQLFGLTYSHDLGFGTFKSVTSYTRQDVLPGLQDNDGTAQAVSGRIDGPDFGYAKTFRKATQYSQELQFSGLAFDDAMDYTFGAFAQIENIDELLYRPGGGRGLLAISGAASNLPFPILVPTDTSFNFGAQDVEKENATYAAFAQFSYDINDIVELTVGGRYTLEKRELTNNLATISSVSAIDLLNQGVAAGHLAPLGPVYFAANATGLTDFYNQFVANGYVLDQITPFIGDDDYSQFTPMVSLKFSAPDDLADALGLDLATAYVTYSSGFKSGGLEAATAGMARFSPEKVDNYEFGFKLDALESRLRINGAVFYTDYQDIQIRNAQLFGDDGNVEILITNAGKAEITGAELEVTYQPIDSLQIMASAGFLQPDLKEFTEVNREDATQTFDRSDEDFQEVPDKTFSLAFIHTAEFNAGSLTSRVDAYYRDSVYVGIDDLSWDRRDEATLDAYTVANARFTWESADSQWRAAAWVKNITDRRYFEGRVSVLGLVGTTQVTPSLPRTYGLDVTLFF